MSEEQLQLLAKQKDMFKSMLYKEQRENIKLEGKVEHWKGVVDCKDRVIEEIKGKRDTLKIELDTQKVLTDGANGRVQIFNKYRQRLLTERTELKAEIARLNTILDQAEENVGRVYDHITCGKLTKLNTDPQFIINAVDEIETPPLKTVWVRKQSATMYYQTCDEDGNMFGDLIDKARLSNIIKWLEPKATVKVWTEAEPKQWVLGVWSIGNVASGYMYEGYFKGCYVTDSRCSPIEECINKLTAIDCTDGDVAQPDTIPILGIRELTRDDIRGEESRTSEVEFACIDTGLMHGAFRDGKYIRDTKSSDPDLCIIKVIEMLTPAVDAVTLESLEVVE